MGRRTLRRLHFLAAGMLLLGAGVSLDACLPPRGFVLILRTDMNGSQVFDYVTIDVCAVKSDGEKCPAPGSRPTDFHGEYQLGAPGQADSDFVQLPAGLEIAPPEAEKEMIRIHIEATRSRSSSVLATVDGIITQAHRPGHVAVPINLSYLCRTGAPTTVACETIGCIDACLPTLTPESLPPEGTFANEQCLDVRRCYEDGEIAFSSDIEHCTFLVPDRLSGKAFNVALLLADKNPKGKPASNVSAAYCTPDHCLVPVDVPEEPNTSGVLKLPRQVCNELLSGTLLGVVAAPVTSTCPLKTYRVAPVDPWSSVPACAEEAPPASLGAATWEVNEGGSSAARSRQATARLPGPTLFVVGGVDEKLNPIATALLYDAAGVHAIGPKMAHARVGHTVTTIPGPTPEASTALIMGGFDEGNKVLTSREIFSLDSKTFTKADQEMKQGTWLHTATMVGESVIVVGGFTDLAGATTSRVERHHTADGTVEDLAALDHALIGHTATAWKGDLIVIGGQLSPGTPPLDEILVIDAGSGTKKPPKTLTVGRAFHATTDLLDGRLLVTGGGTLTSVSPGKIKLTDQTNQAEIVSLTNDCAPSKVAPMHAARAFHTATRMPDGKVLVVGGLVLELSTPPPAELYDPATNEWTLLTAPGAVIRSLHTADLLQNEATGAAEVVVLGGFALGFDKEQDPKKPILLTRPLLAYKLPKSEDPGASADCGTGSGADGGSGGSSGKGSATDNAQLDIKGSGCVASHRISASSCATRPTSTSVDGGPWAFLLLALAARRRSSRRARSCD